MKVLNAVEDDCDTGTLISIDGSDGVVKMDNDMLKIVYLDSLAKLADPTR